MKKLISFLVASLLMLSPALAWTHGVSTSSGFNGGKSQVNFNFLQSGYEYPFLNYLKTAQAWSYITGTTQVNSADLNSDGYPTVINNGGIYTLFFIPSLTDQPLDYKVTWNGSGTIYCPSGTVTSGNKSTSGFTFKPNTTSILLGISAGTNISNLQFFYTGDTAPDSTHIFATKFKSRLTQANFGVLRFLNWQNGNTSTVTTWNTRKPQTYAYYSGSEYRANITPTSAVTNSGNDYSVAAPAVDSVTGLAWDGILRDKTTVTLKFNAAQTSTNGTVTVTATLGNPIVVNWAGNTLSVGDPIGFSQSGTLPGPLFPAGNYFVSATGFNAGVSFEISSTPGGAVINCTNATQSNTISVIRQPTLNVGGTGAFPIKQQNGDIVTNGSNTLIISGIYATLVYDDALKVWLKNGGDTAGGNQGIVNGVPPELMLELAKEVGAHPYYVSPYLTLDPPSDYMPSLAAYNAANQPAWMIPRYEGINEEWNTSQGFYGSRYGWNKAFLYWGTPQNGHNWQGLTTSLLGQIVNAAYGSPSVHSQTLYKVLDGVQTAAGVPTTTASIPRVSSAAFVSTSIPSVLPYLNSAAYNWVTDIAIAQYIQPSEYGLNQELVDAFAWYVTNAGNPTAQAAIAASYVDTLNSGSGFYNLSATLAMYQNWFAFAQSNWGGTINLGMQGYEGGYSPDFLSTLVTSPITGSTSTNPCVLTLATTNMQGISSRSANSGNPAVAGMTLTISGLGGALGTLLNGNTYTVQSGVSGNSVPINVDCSSASYSTSGTATYVNSATWLNALRGAGKNAPMLQTYTTTNYNNYTTSGGVFPSMFQLGGGFISADAAVNTGGAWSVLDPDIFVTPDPPQWTAVVNFNFLLKRDIDPASNDNSPMWLDKAA